MMGKDYWKRRLVKLLFGLLAIILSIGSWPPFLKADSNPLKERYIIHLISQSDAMQWSYKKGFSSQLLKKVNASSRTLMLQLNADEVRKMQLDAEVTLIEKDYTFQLFAEDGHQTINQATYGFEMKPSKQFETTPWGITATQAVYAHQKGIAGQGIKIAVLDTGVDSSHPDLRIAGGYSFVEGEETYEDQQGHGTQVTGIINGLPNGYGVIGMAPEAEIYALKVMDASGMGYYSSVIQAIEWCIQNEIQIVTMSFGGMEDSEILHQVIQEATADHGILFVAAAGNNGAGLETETYPARYSEVLSVGSVNESNQRSPFSSTGRALDLVAPGEQIWSTTVHGEYGLRSGTSLAAPYVAGAAALIWATEPQQSVNQVRAQLIRQAIPLGDQLEYGVGMVQVIGNNEFNATLPSSMNNSQDAEVQKLLRSLLNFQRKAIEQNQMQLGKDIYATYNRLKIESNMLKQDPEKLTRPKASPEGKPVYVNSSVTQSVYQNTTQLSQYAEFQKEPLHDLIEVYQEKRDQILLLLNDGEKGEFVTQSSRPDPFQNLMGDGQVIHPGELASVSFETNMNLRVNHATVTISGPNYSFTDTVDYDDSDMTNPRYAWSTSPSLIPGEYRLVMNCDDSSAPYYFSVGFTIWITEVESHTLQLNTSVHFDLAEGEMSSYLFESGSQFETVTIRTEFLGEYDPHSDTMIFVYSDKEHMKLIDFNDDYDSGRLSSLTITLKPNSTIYIVVSGYDGQSINANLGIYHVFNNFNELTLNVPVDLIYPSLTAGLFSFTPTESTIFNIFTSPYGGASESNDTMLYLYRDKELLQLADYNDDNESHFSMISFELDAGKKYYIVLCGYNTVSVRARLAIQAVDTNLPSIPKVVITNHTANTVSLRWNPSTDDTGVTFYEVYQNSTLVVTLPESFLTYKAVGLAPNTLYTLTVRARDAAGNRSNSSNPVKFIYLIGNVTYIYDVRGRISGVKLPTGQIILYSNDTNGNTTSIVTP